MLFAINILYEFNINGNSQVLIPILIFLLTSLSSDKQHACRGMCDKYLMREEQEFLSIEG